MAVRTLQDLDFKTEIANGLQITDFWADWCMPCKIMSPVVEKLSDDTEEVTFNKVDVDASPQVAREYGIMSIPTLVFTKDGQELGRISGARQYKELKQVIDEIVDLDVQGKI
jgi:thioredoxin 1